MNCLKYLNTQLLTILFLSIVLLVEAVCAQLTASTALPAVLCLLYIFKIIIRVLLFAVALQFALAAKYGFKERSLLKILSIYFISHLAFLAVFKLLPLNNMLTHFIVETVTNFLCIKMILVYVLGIINTKIKLNSCLILFSQLFLILVLKVVLPTHLGNSYVFIFFAILDLLRIKSLINLFSFEEQSHDCQLSLLSGSSLLVSCVKDFVNYLEAWEYKILKIKLNGKAFMQSKKYLYQKQFDESTLSIFYLCTQNAHAVYSEAKFLSSKGHKIVFYGPHAQAHQKEASCFADALVLGDIFSLWDKLYSDYKSDSLKKIYVMQYDQSSMACISKILEQAKSYDLNTVLRLSLGCKNRCAFCLSAKENNDECLSFDVDGVVQLLNKIPKKMRNIIFADQNIISDKPLCKIFFKALANKNIKWSSGASIDIAKDEALLDLAVESGLKRVQIGYEIAEKNKSRNYADKFQYCEDYVELSKRLRERSVKIVAAFIYGFQSDNLAYVFKMIKLAWQIKPYQAAATALTPLPGTKIYRHYLSNSMLLNLNWKKYDLRHVLFNYKDNSYSQARVKFFLARYGLYFICSRLGQIALLMILVLLVFVSAYFNKLY